MKSLEKEIHDMFNRMKEETEKILDDSFKDFDKGLNLAFFIMAIPFILILIVSVIGFILIGG